MEDIKKGYTRVSNIVGQWNKFDKIDKDVLANKCAIGTRVHEAIDADCKGAYLPLDEPDSLYFESYEKWKNQTAFSIVKNEERYYCDSLMITGKPDAIIKMPNEEGLVVIDYKTCISEYKKDWQLQGCFYHYLASKNGIELSPRMLFIKLDKTGELPKVYEYTYTKQLWQICVCAYNCYRYNN
ncbi:MAG: PD-(D/E)XK nuclease family protein [Bacteroidetes bacterium]|nr:PD-(D/E)XK nuclease family protein [Bacteroidota bacterium]